MIAPNPRYGCEMFCHFVACIFVGAKFPIVLPSLVRDIYTENSENYTTSIYVPCIFDGVYLDSCTIKMDIF